MAAKHPRLGLNHVTVVPANFEPATADETVDGTDETDDA